MAADFFDGLVKTLSKTTKELGKTTKELGTRAEQTIEAQKLKNKIAGEERIIEKIKVDIGDVIYRRHSQGDGIDNELSSLCQEIDQHSDRGWRHTPLDSTGGRHCAKGAGIYRTEIIWRTDGKNPHRRTGRCNAGRGILFKEQQNHSFGRGFSDRERGEQRCSRELLRKSEGLRESSMDSILRF